MPAMGEQVKELLQARGAEIKARIEEISTSPLANQIRTDLQAVAAAVDTLVADVQAGLDAAFEQATGGA